MKRNTVITLRHLRLLVKLIYNVDHPFLLVFNEQRLTPLGMSDYGIADSDILASDSFESHGPWLGRLHSSTGCWAFLPAETFLLVDLGVGLVLVGGVATQGCNNDEQDLYGYVLEYLLSFSDDGAGWHYYLEERAPKVINRWTTFIRSYGIEGLRYEKGPYKFNGVSVNDIKESLNYGKM